MATHRAKRVQSETKWSLCCVCVMRQSPEEKDFLELLDYVRNHKDGVPYDKKIIELLKCRFVPGPTDRIINEVDDFVGNDNPDGMVITFTNKMANEYNHLILMKRINNNLSLIWRLDAKFFIDQKGSYYPSNLTDTNFDHEIHNQREIPRIHLASKKEIDIFCGAMKKRYINSIIPFSLSIAPGCRVMLLQNIDLSRGLINGARGVFIQYLSDIDALLIKFDIQPTDENPIIITRKKSVEYEIHDGKTIFMYQFPVKLAWAVTAHKSQGQTLTRAAINIGEPAFAHGSLYVALSRVKSLRNIMLFGMNEWPKNGPNFHE